MTRKTIVITVAVVLLIAGAVEADALYHAGDQEKAKTRVETVLETQHVIGMSPGELAQVLNRAKVENDGRLNADNTMQAIVRNTSHNFPITGDVTLLFRFDARKRVTSYTVQSVYTGP